jgi:hypothetical protein
MALATLARRFNNMNPWRHSRVAVAPPVLTNGRRFPYGPFQFRTQLPKDTEYTIEASPDLQHWAPIHQGEATVEGCDYLDSEAFKHSYRFYRVQVEEIRSLNVIGYASVTLPPGFSMIANPLEGPCSTVAELFQGWPDGTTLNKFDTRFFRLAENSVKVGKWTNANEKLSPGEGAMFFNPTADYRSISFVGDVVQGHLSVPIPSGFSIRSSLLPLPGNLEDLGFPIADGDVIHLYDRDRQKYVLYPYEGKKWKDGTPIVGVGESFWVAKTEPGNWIQTLNANEE